MMVDPYVQQWVAATNGRLYVPVINKLPRYPIPDCPLPSVDGQLMLDIGCGWGRWMVSASRKGYMPIGIEIKLDALQAARRVMLDHNVEGYVVAADLNQLPFKSCIFDAAFSYSVIQHVHKQRARACVEDVHRVLREGGLCMLQFPTKYGVGNTLRRTSRNRGEWDNYDSWCVRYYSIDELEGLFGRVFGNFCYRPDCYLGIGVQRPDIDILPWRYKPIVVISEALTTLSHVLPFLKGFADSIYVVASKDPSSYPHSNTDVLARFRRACDKFKGSNLPVLDLLVCPVTSCDLHFDSDRQELVSKEAGVAYPVIDGIPVMLLDHARKL